MYETDRLPADWTARCNRLDQIWVPTEFHRASFARAGVVASKLVVVPEPVDVSLFDPARHAPLPLAELGEARSADPNSDRRAYVFLSVFKWEARKGWDVLLRAFLLEFAHEVQAASASRRDRAHARAEGVSDGARSGGSDGGGASSGERSGGGASDEQSRGVGDPILVLKTSPFYSSDDFQGMIREFARKEGLPEDAIGAVRVLDRALPLSQLPRLYRAADAFVLPSRGEGWGRPHAEAMAMGLPTIATNWSGPTGVRPTAVSDRAVAPRARIPVRGSRAPGWRVPLSHPSVSPCRTFPDCARAPTTCASPVRCRAGALCTIGRHCHLTLAPAPRRLRARPLGSAFMSEENAFPVRVHSLQPVLTDDETLRAEGHLWAEPDVDHLRERMRWIYNHPREAAERGKRAREHMIRNYSPEVVAELVRDRLVELVATAPASRARGTGSREPDEL
jgi:glycosyltransferase involved in cell wall biosynthesis